MTWKLWRAMRHPPTRNPLFRRAYLAPEQPAPWYIGCARWFGIVLALPVIAFAAHVYGLGWSVGISNLLGKVRESRAFELLSLCPSGPLGMSWATATGYLYHHRTFKNINAPGNLYARVTVAAMVLMGFGLVFEPLFTRALLFSLVVRTLTLALALYIDHVQSLVVAVLAGMLAPALGKSRVNAQLYAFTGYLGVQLATYLLTIAVGFSVLPAALDSLRLTGPGAELVLIGARLLIFYGARELLIQFLWSLLREQLNPDPMEARVLTRDRAWSVTPR